MSDLSTVLKRLEAATLRLEEIVSTRGATSASIDASMGSAPSAAASATIPAPVADFDVLISTTLKAFGDKASAVGGLVADQAASLASAFAAQRDFILLASHAKKPAAADLPELLKPTQTHLEAVIKLREGARSSPLFNHLSIVSEGIPALGWVAVEPTPVPYIGEMKDAAQFYSNRVIKEYKDKDKTHVEYAQTFVALLTELQAYVKKYHTTGIAWNLRGGDAKALASSTPLAPPATGGAPPPPPPPTAAQLEQFGGGASAKPAAGAALSNVFSALNQGSNVTAGLRKVDKSEMTHKNPELRAAGVVPSAPAKPTATAPPKFGGAVAPKAPPKLALEGNKWVVENYVNAPEPLVIEAPELRHTVYIFNCQNSTIQVKGKVNAVTLDGCKKSGLLLESVVSTVDIVNCKSVQVQITGKAPTVAIDKTDGCQVYLSKLSVENGAEVEVLTAMSSECNVLVEGEGEDGGFIERPVPEQIKNTVRAGKMESTIVEHKG
ncbi:adenylate cyclase associated N terminal-domain-containing protein [Chytriomyces sp. MP71]|nr:adenylate cyclase associated N terminal-domain-containing protein [Chytriomyces sp. MP71]